MRMRHSGWKCFRVGLLLLVTVTLFMTACAQEQHETTTLTLFRWDLNIEGPDPIGDRIADEVGVRIEPLTAPWAGWPERLNAMIAGGDAPDVFVGYGIMSRAQYDTWIQDGLLLSISDHVDEYPYLAEYVERWDEQRVGGKLYSLPVEAHVDHVLMVRGDWLDALGLAAPDTVDDFMDVSTAFRNAYGVFPVSSSAPHTAGLFWLNMFLYAFGSSWNDWLARDDGTYIPSWIADESLDAVRYLRDLYQEQLLDPDFVTNTDSEKQQRFVEGRQGMVVHNLVADYRRGLSERFPEGRIDVLPPVAGPGGRGMWGLNGFFSAVMLSADLDGEKREAALALLNYLYSPEGVELLRHGIAGEHHRMENGKLVPTFAPVDDPSNLPELHLVVPHASLKFLRALEWMWVPEWSPFYADMTTSLEIGRTYSRPERFPFIPTVAQADLGQPLTDLAFEKWVELIVSTAGDIDTGWDTFVRRYLELGGERLITEMNEAIADGR